LLYVKDKKTFFDKIHELLNPDGIFIFTATNPESWRYILTKLHSKSCKDYYEERLLFYENLIFTGYHMLEIYGFMWQPFKLNSNSICIDFFEKIEMVLLSQYIKQSPWWLFAIRKKER